MFMTIISETKMDITSTTLELTAENLQYIHTGPKFWNTLPQQLREAVSEHQFKRKLKDFLVSRY